MQINDPKTPFEDEDPYEAVENDVDNTHENEDPVVEAHLNEAKVNRDLNADIISKQAKQMGQQNPGGAINIGDLLGKLNTVKQ